MADTQFFPLAAAQQNLKRLLLIRLIVLVCQVSALAYAWAGLGLQLNYGAIGVALGLVIAVNAGVAIRLTGKTPVSDMEFLCHLLFDVLALAVLIYLSGGANNPFVSFFLVPITISAAILPWSYTWTVAGFSLSAYTLLLFFYHPLPVLMPADTDMTAQGGISNLHITGMWFNFLVSTALITYFVVKMAAEIRSREAILNRYREENLRDEQILAVATEAAGTAHELGTPLNTMAILVRELEDDYKNDRVLAADLAVIEKQIEICKKSLKDLSNRADFRVAGKLRETSIRDFISRLHEQWRLIRPEVKLSLTCPDEADGPVIAADSTLQQALVNILNNAADASPRQVDVGVGWDEAAWYFRVRDYGEGIDKEVMQYLGSEIITDKEKGMGVGMILSQASINRLGGKVNITAHPDVGTVTEVRLPLKAL